MLLMSGGAAEAVEAVVGIEIFAVVGVFSGRIADDVTAVVVCGAAFIIGVIINEPPVAPGAIREVIAAICCCWY